ncbi:MAG: hypothetical protein HVK27_04600 [Pelagibacteraceae bacterium]|nr:hypothetical protein [Pelagibacteraceae bacterium]
MPTEDALIVKRMRNAGAIVVGKSNTPESVPDHRRSTLSSARH